MYKNIFEGKKALIFDMDGTIVETDDQWERAFSTVLTTLNDQEIIIPPKEGLYTGDKWKRVLERYPISTDLSIDELTNLVYQKFVEIIEAEGVEEKEGFYGFMVELLNRPFKLVLASNTDKWVVEKVVEKMGIKDKFSLIVGGNEAKNRKPSPDIYKIVMNKLGLKNEECLIFEDSTTGIEAAVKSGVDTVAMWDGQTQVGNYPRQVVHYISDFDELIGNMDDTLVDRMAPLVYERYLADKEKGLYTQEQINEIDAYFKNKNLGNSSTQQQV